MNYKKQPLNKKTINRLLSHGIWPSDNAPPITKEIALILIGQAMLDNFIKEFVGLWKNELFPHCRLKDYQATDEDWRRWLGRDCKSSKYCKGVNKKMDADTKKRLDDYIELLDEISEKTEDASTAVAILHEISKDRRSEQMRSERQGKKDDTVTFKQKKCMKRLGIDFPDDISRKEASMLIQEELEKLNGVGE